MCEIVCNGETSALDCYDCLSSLAAFCLRVCQTLPVGAVIMRPWIRVGVLPALLALPFVACNSDDGDQPTADVEGAPGDATVDSDSLEDIVEAETDSAGVPDASDGNTDADDTVEADATDAGSDADASDGSVEPTPVPDDPLWTTLQEVVSDSARPPAFAFDGGFPTVLSGSWPAEGENPVDRARAFLSAYSELYPIEGEDLQIRVGRVDERDGESFVSWRQTYQGFPVHNGELVVNLDDSGVFLVAGRLLTTLVDVDTTARIAGSDAERLAREALGMESSPVQGSTRLVVVDTGIYGSGLPMKPVLAWRVSLPTMVVLVNAGDGTIVETEPTVHDTFDLDLIDANGEPGDGLLCWYLGTLEDEDAADEDEVFDTHTSDSQVIQTRLLHSRAYNFFLDTFGIDSYDNDGAQQEVYVHVGGEPNASYNRGCDTFQYHDRYTGALDIAVHEVTHAVVGASSGLIYKNESGALNESYADIMGAIADGNWTLGEDAPVGAIRSFRTPEDFGHPFNYTDYRVISDDNGGVHTNSSIMNHAFYMMAVGSEESGRTVVRQRIEAVPIESLSALFYATMRSLPNSSTMRHAAQATIARAESWASTGKNGFTARHLCDIRNSFEWVSLGAGDLDCDGVADVSDLDDDQDGVFDQFDNCRLVQNPAQEDADFDQIGNLCDDDIDNDGLLNAEDNCPERPNPSQSENFFGDALACCCDIDLDDTRDEYDNCPWDSNPAQEDEDSDGFGDVCDYDPDNDGIQTDEDNCPFVANAEQEDEDEDFIGDSCDACPSTSEPGTAWSMGIPELGIEPQPLSPDTDGDGTPDACDTVPFGVGIAVTLGREVLNPADPVAPSGVAGQYGFTAEVGDVIQLPLAPCDECPEYFGEEDGIDLRFDSLPPTVLVWISDEFGNSRGWVSGPTAGITAPPVFLGTRSTNESNLLLNVRFLPGFTGNTSFRITSTPR